jgi:hypothetical protein
MYWEKQNRGKGEQITRTCNYQLDSIGMSIAENDQLVCVSFKWQVQSKHEATHWSDGVLSVFMSELLEMMLAPWQLADFPVGLPGRVE